MILRVVLRAVRPLWKLSRKDLGLLEGMIMILTFQDNWLVLRDYYSSLYLGNIRALVDIMERKKIWKPSMIIARTLGRCLFHALEIMYTFPGSLTTFRNNRHGAGHCGYTKIPRIMFETLDLEIYWSTTSKLLLWQIIKRFQMSIQKFYHHNNSG